MPTTLTGLLLFVALLLPGYVFVVLVQHDRPQRRLSPLQESAAVAFVSVLTDLVALGVFGILDALSPTWTPDVSSLIRDPGGYLPNHYLPVLAWALGLLLSACVIAAMAGWFMRHRPVHPSKTSSWWTLFERWQPGKDRHVQCILDDGSYVSGQLGDWNMMAEESADRDLTLTAPITYRPAGATDPHPHPVGAVCIAARRIVAIFVTYCDPITSAAEAAEEVAAEEEAAALPQAPHPASGSESHPDPKA